MQLSGVTLPRARTAEPKKFPDQDVRMSALEDKAFVWLVIAISLAFAWVLWPCTGQFSGQR
jgi:hypothetical protein